MWTVAQELMRDAAANFAAIVRLENLIRVRASTPAMTSDCFTTADDFAPVADDNDLQWFAKELSEALVVKIRGVLGEDVGDLKEITLLNRTMRYGQTMGGWPFLVW